MSNGEYVIVEKVQHEILENPVKVYNFEVQDFYTYYVSENSVLVHNMCQMAPKSENENTTTEVEKSQKKSLWDRFKGIFKSDNSDYIGIDFVPNGNSVQEGVNPNSLIPSKDLDSLDSQRMNNAVKYAGDKPIVVNKNGVVLDGHHRLKYAIMNNKAVDVTIGY